MRVVIPAFAISELKTGFQMGFFLFVPFLLIDLVVSTTLLSMGMLQLPPAMISLPFKMSAVRDGRRLEPARGVAGPQFLCNAVRWRVLEGVLCLMRLSLASFARPSKSPSSSRCRCSLAGLVAGVLVSIFQTVTSIQDNVLAFIPRAIAIFIVFALTFPWMLRVVSGFSASLIQRLPELVR